MEAETVSSMAPLRIIMRSLRRREKMSSESNRRVNKFSPGVERYAVGVGARSLRVGGKRKGLVPTCVPTAALGPVSAVLALQEQSGAGLSLPSSRSQKVSESRLHWASAHVRMSIAERSSEDWRSGDCIILNVKLARGSCGRMRSAEGREECSWWTDGVKDGAELEQSLERELRSLSRIEEATDFSWLSWHPLNTVGLNSASRSTSLVDSANGLFSMIFLRQILTRSCYPEPINQALKYSRFSNSFSSLVSSTFLKPAHHCHGFFGNARCSLVNLTITAYLLKPLFPESPPIEAKP